MKINSKIVFSAMLSVLLPFIVGLSVVMAAMLGEYRNTALSFMELYADSISSSLSSFFNEARSVAFLTAGLESTRAMDIEAAREDLDAITGATLVQGIGIADSGGALYDMDTRYGNAPVSVADMRYFREVISASEGTVITEGPYIVRGRLGKSFVTATPVISGGRTVGAVNVYQSYTELSTVYASLMEGFFGYFGPDAQVYLIAGDEQIVSNVAYDSVHARRVEAVASDVMVAAAVKLQDELLSAFDEASRTGSAALAKIGDSNMLVMAREVSNSPLSVYISVPRAYIYRTASRVLSTGIIVFLILIFAMHVLLFFTAFHVSRSVNTVNEVMQTIATGEGDLTRHLDVVGNDEIADLSEGFNRFVASLNSMVSDVKAGALSMSSIGDRLEKDVDEIRENVFAIVKDIENMNFAVEEQSSSVTEVSSTITQIAQNIESLSSQIESQSTSVTESAASVQQMVSNINAISTNLTIAATNFEALKNNAASGKTSINNVYELVSKFSSQSDSLLEANAVISAIAGQTNLLAMNAAIEAAHAGDAGKGFAVVAEEIRNLAENAAEQSKSIASVLSETVKAIKNIAEAANVADTSFDAVSSMIDAVSALVSEISLSMSEQNAGNRQVLEGLADIENVTAQIRDGAVEMNSGTASILKEMSRLSGVSENVKQGSDSIAHSADAIGSAVAKIGLSSSSNKEAIKALANLTSRFKI